MVISFLREKEKGMNKDIKAVRDFKAAPDIDEIIEGWAENSGFKESVLPRQISSDDVAYCFCLDEGASRALLTINILDDKVHLEAWTASCISEKRIPREGINTLLEMLGQPIIQ